MSDIKRIETGPRMSQAVVHGGVVYLAGQVGTRLAPASQCRPRTSWPISNVCWPK